MAPERGPGKTWEKSPQHLIDLYDAALPSDPAVVRRKVFGFPSAFVNGNMFSGLRGARVVVGLPDPLYRELLALPGAAPWEYMPGRAKQGFLMLPEALHADTAAVATWLERAFRRAAALPPKEPKPRAARKKRV